MDQEPTLPITLRPSKVHLLGFLALSVAFTAGGLWMASEGQVAGYFIAAFFGLGVLVFLVLFLPGSAYLHLTQEGFTVRSMYRGQTLRWSDVEFFRVVRIGGNDMVGWDFASHYQAVPRGRAVARALAGAEGALPNTFGMKAQALADLMNRLRERSA